MGTILQELYKEYSFSKSQIEQYNQWLKDIFKEDLAAVEKQLEEDKDLQKKLRRFVDRRKSAIDHGNAELLKKCLIQDQKRVDKIFN